MRRSARPMGVKSCDVIMSRTLCANSSRGTQTKRVNRVSCGGPVPSQTAGAKAGMLFGAPSCSGMGTSSSTGLAKHVAQAAKRQPRAQRRNMAPREILAGAVQLLRHHSGCKSAPEPDRVDKKFATVLRTLGQQNQVHGFAFAHVNKRFQTKELHASTPARPHVVAHPRHEGATVNIRNGWLLHH